MHKRFALTRLQAILIIDLLIVASAAGGYYYIQSQIESTAMPTPPPPKPAEFQVTNLTFNALEAEENQPIIIAVNVANVGEESGSYSVVLYINDILKENKTVQLAGNKTTSVEFIVIETNEGTYTARIDDLTGTFKIIATSPTPEEPKPASFSLYNAYLSPVEAWLGDPIGVAGTVTNYGDLAGDYLISLTINGAVKENKTITLLGKQTTKVEFTFIGGDEGEYLVRLNNLIAGFLKIVPSGFHTLSINAYSGRYVADDLAFTLDGENQVTPYSSLTPVGTHTIVMPWADPTGQYTFLYWEDPRLTDPTRTINLTGQMVLSASYSGGGSSCPSLYIWNGTNYIYVAEVSNHGWLGYIKCINEDGSIKFWRKNPWDYSPLY